MPRFLFILVTSVFLLSDPAAAQVLYGTIVGNVRDRTGAAAPMLPSLAAEPDSPGRARPTKSDTTHFPTCRRALTTWRWALQGFEPLPKPV